MDTLSELLDGHPARGDLDVRCQWSGRWSVPHVAEAPGTVRFHVVMRGVAYLRVAGETPRELAAGDIVVLPSGDAHILAGGQDEWNAPRPNASLRTHPLLKWQAGDEAEHALDMFCGRIDFGGGAATLLASLPRVLHLPGDASLPLASLAPLIELMRREVNDAAPGARSVVGQLSSALFVLALRHWWSRSDELHGVLGLLREPRLRPACTAMLLRLHEPLTVETLAAACHMSRSSFLRLFERATQATPANMLVQLRMDTAAVRLRRDSDGIAKVAEMVGFLSESAFIRAFERHKGVSPAVYRKQRDQVH